MNILLDPRLYSRDAVTVAANALQPGGRVIVLGNPLQKTLLEAARVPALYFDDYPIAQRLSEYQAFVSACSRPLLAPVTIGPWTFELDLSVILSPKRDSALLWLRRFHTEAAADVKHAVTAAVTDDALFARFAHEDRRFAGVARIPPSRQRRVRATAEDLVDVLRELSTFGRGVLRARGKRPRLMFRARRELSGIEQQLGERFSLIGPPPASLSARMPRPRIDRTFAGRGCFRGEGELESLCEEYLLHQLQGDLGGLRESLAELFWMKVTKCDAFLLSAATGPLASAINALDRGDRPVSVVQHGSFAFTSAAHYERDAKFSDAFLSWYRRPADYLSAPHERLKWIGYPKALRRSPRRLRGRILVAPSQRFCIFDDAIFNDLTAIQRASTGSEVSIRLQPKDDKRGHFGPPSTTLEADLVEADVVVTDMSTVAIDAAFMGRPVVIVNRFAEANHYEAKAMFRVVEDGGAAVESARAWINNPRDGESIVQEQDARLDDEIGVIPRADLIREVMSSLGALHG